MHDQLVDKQEDNDFAWEVTPTDISFSGTTTPWIQPKSLTTAEMNALDMTGIPSAIIYNETESELYQYIGWAWSAVAAGSTQANASTTVAGKVEKATDAQIVAWTATGETGAPLFASPDDLAQQIQSWSYIYGVDAWGDDAYVIALTPVLAAYTAWQLLWFKVTTTNTGACTISFWPSVLNIKTKDWNDPQTGVIRTNGTNFWYYDWTNFVLLQEDFATATVKGVAEMATDAEVITGTDQTRYTNALQVRANSLTKAWNFERLDGDNSGNEVIAHGLWQTPRLVEFRVRQKDIPQWVRCYGTYDWTTNQCHWRFRDGSGENRELKTTLCIQFYMANGHWWTATCTMDATNITLAFTEVGVLDADEDIQGIRVAHA